LQITYLFLARIFLIESDASFNVVAIEFPNAGFLASSTLLTFTWLSFFLHQPIDTLGQEDLRQRRSQSSHNLSSVGQCSKFGQTGFGHRIPNRVVINKLIGFGHVRSCNRDQGPGDRQQLRRKVRQVFFDSWVIAHKLKPDI
jgi:hypothetical protein